MYNEHPTDSIATLVSLINQNFRQNTSSAEERKKHQTKIYFLIDDLLTKGDQINSQNEERNIKQSEKAAVLNKTKNLTQLPADDFRGELEQEVTTSYKTIQAQMASIGPEINRMLWKYKKAFIFVLITYFIVCVTGIIKYGWNTMEPIITIGSIAFVVVNYIILAYYGKSFDPLGFFRVKEQQIRNELYLKYGFNEERFKQLELRRAELASSTSKNK